MIKLRFIWAKWKSPYRALQKIFRVSKFPRFQFDREAIYTRHRKRRKRQMDGKESVSTKFDDAVQFDVSSVQFGWMTATVWSLPLCWLIKIYCSANDDESKMKMTQNIYFFYNWAWIVCAFVFILESAGEREREINKRLSLWRRMNLCACCRRGRSSPTRETYTIGMNDEHTERQQMAMAIVGNVKCKTDNYSSDQRSETVRQVMAWTSNKNDVLASTHSSTRNYH